MKTLLFMTALVAMVATPAMAGIVAENPDSGSEEYSSATDYTGAFDNSDTYTVSNFTTTQDWYVTTGQVLAYEDREDHGNVTSVAFIINALPWESPTFVLEAVVGTDTITTTGTIDADFGGVYLPAGDYYYVHASQRNWFDSGIAYNYQTEDVTGEGDWQYMPKSELFPYNDGQGGSYQEIWNENGDWVDINFVLNGVPEPATLALLGFGALAIIRRRH